MKKIYKKVLSKISLIFFAVLTIVFPFTNAITVNAQSALVLLNKSNVRSTPSTGVNNIIGTLNTGTSIEIIEVVPTIDNSIGCGTGSWYKFLYNGVVAYSCTENFDTRPWTTPKKSIVGGAIYKAENYIEKGQFTSYLVKFNVNPASIYSNFTHQYMTNVRAPYSEANTSYKAYAENNLLSQPLVFSIPIFTGMPEYTTLPEKDPDITGMTAEELNQPDFEVLMTNQGFDETYKKKLRILHQAYPTWIFEALQTNIDWNTAVSAEQPISSVDGDDVSLRETYANAQADGVECKSGSGAYCLKESTNWFLANTQTTSYFMDPRNFLNVDRILMFEKLAYSDLYKEEVVQGRLNGTFMEGISALDNQTYASIFVEAGKTANISPVYLVSQCLQEVGVQGSLATSGEQFTYNGVTYKGLFNFFNIGAYSSEASPVRAGLVWANGKATSTIVSEPVVETPTELSYLHMLGFAKTYGYVTGVSLNQTVSTLSGKISNASLNITDSNGATLSSNSKLMTGSKIVIHDSNNTYNNTVVIYGDISGDGEINAIDLLYMRKYLLKTCELSGANLQAAKIAKGNDVGAADLLYLRKYLLDNQTYKIMQ